MLSNDKESSQWVEANRGSYKTEASRVSENVLSRSVNFLEKLGPAGLVALTSGLGIAVATVEVGDVLLGMNHLAGSVVGRNLAQFSSQELATLVDGLSEGVGRPGCKQVLRALDHIVVYLLQQNLANFASQSLVNGLDKVVGRPNDPIFTVPDGSLAKPESVSQHNPTTLEPQLPANVVREQIASYLSQRNLANFESHQLVDLVSGLSAGESSCKRLLRTRGRVIEQLLQRNWANFDLHQLINVVSGLSGEAEELGRERLLSAWDRAVEQLLQRNRENFDLYQIAYLVGGFGGEAGELGCEQLLSVWDCVVGHFLQCDLPNFKPQQLTTVVKGLREVIESSSGQVPASLNNYFSQHKPTSQCNFQPSKWQLLINLVLEHVALYVSRRNLANCKPQQLVNWVSGFSKVAGNPSCKQALCVLNYLARHLLRQELKNFTPQQLFRLAIGFTEVAGNPDCKQVSGALDHIVVQLLQQTLANFGLKARATINWVVDYILRRDLAGFTTQQLVSLVNGLGQLDRNPSYQLAFEAMGRLAENILRRDLANFTSHQLANLVDGLSQALRNPNCWSVLKALDCIAKNILQRNCEAFGEHDLVKVVSGLSQGVGMSWSDCQAVPVTRGCVSRFIGVLERYVGKQLAGITASSSGKWIREALNHLANSIPQRNLADLEGQELINLIRGLSKEVEKDKCRARLIAISHIAISIRTNFPAGRLSKADVQQIRAIFETAMLRVGRNKLLGQSNSFVALVQNSCAFGSQELAGGSKIGSKNGGACLVQLSQGHSDLETCR